MRERSAAARLMEPIGAAGFDDRRPPSEKRWGGSDGGEAQASGHAVSQDMPDRYGLDRVDAAHQEAGKRSIAGLGVERFRVAAHSS
jgi:hypothetical protein